MYECVHVSFAQVALCCYRLGHVIVLYYCYVQLCNHVVCVFLFCKTGLSDNSQVSRVMIIVCVGGVGDWSLALMSRFLSTNVYAAVMW